MREGGKQKRDREKGERKRKREGREEEGGRGRKREGEESYQLLFNKTRLVCKGRLAIPRFSTAAATSVFSKVPERLRSNLKNIF